MADGLPGGVQIVSGVFSLRKKNPLCRRNKGLLVVRGFVTKKKMVDARIRLKRVAIRSVKFALHFNGLSPFPFNYFKCLSP